MRVLWTVNLIPTQLAKHLGEASTVLGGWVESMSSIISQTGDVELGIACKCDGNRLFNEKVDNIKYYSLSYPLKKQYDTLKLRCEQIIDDFKPDIVQIDGTEFLHALVMADLCNKRGIKTVVSLQGILNGQYAYQCGELPIDDMIFSLSLSKITTAWILRLRKRMWFAPRMATEKKVLEKANVFIGRTTWDRAHTYSINPEAKYFTCNRILRTPFYNYSWKSANAERHSIYVGNGYHALKGLHFMLQAMPQLIREYPDTKLYVAGYKPYEEHDRRPFYKKGYAMLLQKIVKENNLEKYVIFTGPLNSEQVAERLSKTHVYVLCSTVENSPNTLGEAMMIGTPSVAAYVGGVSDMARDGKEALYYRSNDPSLLAWSIKRIFDNDDLAQKLSENGRIRARELHNPGKNAEELITIYKAVQG